MLFIPAFIPPVMCLLVAMLLFRHRLVIWELVGQVAAPTVISLIAYFCMMSNLTNDTEYRGYYITAVKHEEDWNEYIHKTCSREHCSGSGKNRSCTTEYYDCSYVQYHPPEWYAIMNDHSRVNIDQSYYARLTNTFKGVRKVGHHSGYTNDGDIFQCDWDKKWEHLQPYVDAHTYKNKVQASNSVFKFEEVTEEDAKLEGLYNYPKTTGFNVSSVMGGSSPELDKINATYGKRHQIRVWLLIYEGKGMDTFERQRSYWQGSNKNELVLGVGTKGGVVTWANKFSWSEADEFTIDCRAELEKLIGKKFSDVGICKHLKAEIPKGWERKEFADFEYLKVEIPPSYMVIIFFISLVPSVGLCIFFVMNDENAGRDENQKLAIVTWSQEKWRLFHKKLKIGLQSFR
jgi:hypothetical protein